ncbi:MAG: phospho-sugar mutase [Coriobacteriales bacterium]
MDVMQEYQRWCSEAAELPAGQLEALAGDEEAILDAFRCELSFGTAGLRGIIGAGPNRMNVYTVGKATQGLADYLNATFDKPSVAIARDSRNCGDLFVRTAAGVLAANGVTAYVYTRPVPTPALSFAVRHLGCSAGINITASHNPAAYNGYKAYGPDGCQIASHAADAIQASIDNTDFFTGIKKMSLAQAVEQGLVKWITQETLDAFVNAVLEQSLSTAADEDCQLSVVYTPLNGAGLECVSTMLERIGITDVVTVPEQAQPDGSFPTCPYPNPEIREALARGLELCEGIKPDLLLATDPDADRVGIAVPHAGEYHLLTGNEVGVLLTDYACRIRTERGEDLSRAVVVSTIVSSSMTDALARDYGFQLRRTLTGFKHIGGQIALLEQAGTPERFALGFEESYGYLAGTHVRDKDAVVASMLICQMARYYKARGLDLYAAMEQLYAKYGYYKNATISLSYPGAAGAAKMAQLTAGLRAQVPGEVAGFAVERAVDYLNGAPMPVVNPVAGEGEQLLPGADLIELQLQGGSKLMIRPSGTEPKIKAYIFAYGLTREASEQVAAQLEAAARQLLS